MGKAGKLRKRAPKYNPLSKKNEQEDPQQEIQAESTVLPVMEKLNSANAEDRAMALSAANSLIDQPHARKQLLKQKLVQTVLTKHLTDSNDEVVAEAYGLLRNLVIEQGPDVAMFIYRQDVLTALKGTFSKWMAKQDEASCEEGGMKVLLAQMENMLGLITALASSSDEIYQAVLNNLDMAPTLLELVGICQKHHAEKVFCQVAEALYVLSEANPEFVNQVSDCPVDRLMGEEVPESARVYLNGLKFNAIATSLDSNDPQLLKSVQVVLLDIMRKLVPLVENVDTSEFDKVMESNNNGEEVKDVNALASQARAKIDQVQTAMELFAAVAEALGDEPRGAGAGEDAENEDENELDEDEMEVMAEEGVEIIGKEYNEDNEPPAVSYLHTTVLPLLVKLLPDPVFEERAMMALNNVCWTIQQNIPTRSQRWSENAQELWTCITPYLDSGKDIEVLNGTVGVMWAVAKAFGGKVPITQETTRHIILLTKQIDVKKPGGEEFMTRVVGLLGCVGQNTSELAITQLVSDFIISIVKAPLEHNPVVLVETLNALFDLFGDKSYSYDEPLFVRGNVLNTLQQSLTKVRQAVKKVDKNKDKMLRAQADEAAMNLERFIAYKKKERK